MPVRPTLLHRMALVSFLLFRKNLGNLREFFGQMVYRPPLAKNCPYAYGRDEPKAQQKIVLGSRVLCNNCLEGLFTQSQVLLSSIVVVACHLYFLLYLGTTRIEISSHVNST